MKNSIFGPDVSTIFEISKFRFYHINVQFNIFLNLFLMGPQGLIKIPQGAQGSKTIVDTSRKQLIFQISSGLQFSRKRSTDKTQGWSALPEAVRILHRRTNFRGK